MALGFSHSDGGGQDYLPILKFDSKARIWNLRTRVQSATGGWENVDREIAPPEMPSFLADLAEVEVGWIRFAPTPDFQTIPISKLQAGTPFPPRPPQAANKQEQYRQGFRVLILMPDHLGGDARHFSHTAACVTKSFDTFHDFYMAERAAHPGQVPIVRVAGYDAIKSEQGTNYAPKFQIDGWADRPFEFDEHVTQAQAAPAHTFNQPAPTNNNKQSSNDPPPYDDRDAPPARASFRGAGR